MIGVTGATGQLGSLVIKNLLKQVPSEEIVALTRSKEKAEALEAKGVAVRTADYNRPETLTSAFEGINKLLLISSSEVGKRKRQHEAVISAAKAAGVKFIAYTSILNADSSPLGLADEHRATEQFLKASGIAHAILRNGWYTENYALGAPAAVEIGALYGCAGDGRISSASRADFAEAAAAVMTFHNQEGKIYELAGDSAYTLTEFAAEISARSSKEIPYINLPENQYAEALIAAQLPEPIALMLADSDAGAAKGALYSESKDLSQLIGHPTTPYAHEIQKAIIQ